MSSLCSAIAFLRFRNKKSEPCELTFQVNINFVFFIMCEQRMQAFFQAGIQIDTDRAYCGVCPEVRKYWFIRNKVEELIRNLV